MIVPGMFVCSSFLISVCMFIVSKTLLISSATVIVRVGGAIWLNPFAMVFVVLCFVPVLHGCVCCYVRKKAFLQCLQLLVHNSGSRAIFYVLSQIQQLTCT